MELANERAQTDPARLGADPARRRAGAERERVAAGACRNLALRRSFSRGISSTRLHGRVRASSWWTISFSQASRHAPDEPGRTNTKVALATPASARDCSVEVPISS